MKYPKSNNYDQTLIKQKMMGPNSIKLLEELLANHFIKHGGLVLDLGCGQGLTSLFLVKEYGFKVIAADLWIEPDENDRFFAQMHLRSDQIKSIKADAMDLPFQHNQFDAIVSVDSFHYFVNDAAIIGEKLLPFVKNGGYVYVAIPGFKQDFGNEVRALFESGWSQDEIAMIHDIEYWTNLLRQVPDIEIVSIKEMESNREVWDDWLACENEYATADRLIMDHGGAQYLNFIQLIFKRIR
ncbi:MAG TPA: class I SAM-dependent methyltransferase [Bacilli bacterium]|nr:class I SAM-dependent methyltransferase [Bacilli bacterium]